MQPEQESFAGKHAVVIGGSMAGILTARVLLDSFEQVTIIDRDVFPETPEHRKGVPQSHHAHGLLVPGRVIINELFPGIMNDLRADGATESAGDIPFVIVSPAGKLKPPPGSTDQKILAFSRYLLEWHMRERLKRMGGVRLIENTEVTRLLGSDDSLRVTGVATRKRGVEGEEGTVLADLVIDASGRTSHAPRWLIELGYEAPVEEKINSGISYASRFYEKPAHFPNDWVSVLVNRRPPDNPRAGLVLPVEHNRWHVTLGGMAGHVVPTDEEGFLQWARDLPDPSIYEALRVARPLSSIRGYRTPENWLRHFERLQCWPKGFLVIGDAVCAFNPVYGQGMASSALQALDLAQCLKEQEQHPHADFERSFQQRIARTVAAPWFIATSEDLRWKGVKLSGARQPLGISLQHFYMNLVLRCAVEDPALSTLYQAVLTMLAPPQALSQPHIVLRVLLRSLKRVFTRRERATPEYASSAQSLALLRSWRAFDYKHASI